MDEQFLKRAEGYRKITMGLGRAQFMTPDAFMALQRLAVADVEREVESGESERDVLMALKGWIQETIDAATTSRLPIQDETEDMIRRAEHYGIEFKQDFSRPPYLARMLDMMRSYGKTTALSMFGFFVLGLLYQGIRNYSTPVSIILFGLPVAGYILRTYLYAPLKVWLAERSRAASTQALPDLLGSLNYQVGLASLQTGDDDAATKAFEDAVGYSPGLIPAKYNLAIEYIKRGRYADAANELRMVAEGAPLLSGPHFSLAMAYERLGEHTKAAEELTRAQRLEVAHISRGSEVYA